MLLARKPRRHFTYTDFKANYIQPDVTRACLPRPCCRWRLATELFSMMGFFFFNFNQTRKMCRCSKRLFINSSCGHLPTSNSANHINTSLCPPVGFISGSSPPSMIPHSCPHPSRQNSFVDTCGCCNEYCLHRPVSLLRPVRSYAIKGEFWCLGKSKHSQMCRVAFVKNLRERTPLQISICNQLYLVGLGFTKYNKCVMP